MAARSGEYGTPSYDRTAAHAEAMLNAIEREMPNVSSFTRDDLLFLTPFMHVATITRYAYVRAAVQYCIETNRILAIDRTTLILAKGKRRYKEYLGTLDEYEGTVRGLIARRTGAVSEYFNVPLLLELWTTDEHLSTSTKRTILREALKAMATRGGIKAVGFSTYTTEG